MLTTSDRDAGWRREIRIGLAAGTVRHDRSLSPTGSAAADWPSASRGCVYVRPGPATGREGHVRRRTNTGPEPRPKSSWRSATQQGQAVAGGDQPEGGGRGGLRGARAKVRASEQTFFLLGEELLEPVYAIYPGLVPRTVHANCPLLERNEFQQALFSHTARVSVGAQALPADFFGGRGRAGPACGEAGDGRTAPIAVAPASDQAGEPVTDESPFSLAAASYSDKVRDVTGHRLAGLRGVVIAWVSLAAALGAGRHRRVRRVPPEGVPDHPGRLRPAHLLRRGAVRVLHGLVGAARVVLDARWEPRRRRQRARWRCRKQVPKCFSPCPHGSRRGCTHEAAHRGWSGPAPPPRVRQRFPETLLWRPELITDDQGQATLDIELADSITTWRLSTSAVSGAGQLGGAEFPMRVFQPFFVDLNLPVVADSQRRSGRAGGRLQLPGQAADGQAGTEGRRLVPADRPGPRGPPRRTPRPATRSSAAADPPAGNDTLPWN